MFEVLLLLVVISILGIIYSKNSESCRITNTGLQENKDVNGSGFFFTVIVVILVCFSGLRTRMNDTTAYIRHFNDLEKGIHVIKTINWELGANPLFKLYQILVKSLISQSANAFLFVTSTIVVLSFTRFIKKYSSDFSLSIYIFIAFYVYGFSMAAMKQTLATAIAIWVIPDIYKKKFIKAVIRLLIAMMIHPYVFVFVAAFIFRDQVWSKKIVLLILATIAVVFSFAEVIEKVLKFTEEIGENYALSTIVEGNGVNIFRVLFYAIIPVLSLINRHKIRELNNQWMNLCVNMCIVALCFSIISISGGAVSLGRIPNYFGLLLCITLPYMIEMLPNVYKQPTRVILVISYTYFYWNTYIRWHGTSFMTECFYEHISIIELIERWFV